MKDTLLLLDDLLETTSKIERFADTGKENFLSDEKTQFPVIRAYEVVGEICKRLPTEFRDSHAEINWRKLIGFRDFLAHNYEEIILEFVWAAVEDLPELRTVVRAARDRLAGS
ncbi:MAG: DUF86 domain-containing protein [Anaerolineae bacterium]|nr:DUF86 domain-containing protein [Anaerolineae bacterium]